MVYEAALLFLIFPRRLTSGEGVDTVFPVKDANNR